MTISAQDLQKCIHLAGFPMEKRTQVTDIITQGLIAFREHRERWYYSSATGKKIKKPTQAHNAPAGRHDQSGARTMLISALCRAWLLGFDRKPTLNNKNDRDTDFSKFAMEVMEIEGIGRAHQYLEEYWSLRKVTLQKRDNT